MCAQPLEDCFVCIFRHLAPDPQGGILSSARSGERFSAAMMYVGAAAAYHLGSISIAA